jgi:GT2 family glycosyltransferase
VTPEVTSVIIVTHNSVGLVQPVLDALAEDPEQAGEVIVVDSGSTDGTVDLLAGYDVTVVAQQDNVGFAGGCHIGARAARGENLVFLGHDTVPHPGWLGPLVGALGDQDVGVAMATIEDADHPGTFNTSGGVLTYFGLAWISDSGAPIPNEESPVEVAFPSGAATAIRKETWNQFGGFREPFFMYHEDTDLGWRLKLAGKKVVRVPASRVSHKYDFSRSAEKMYHLERNRWIMLRSNYRRRTIAVLSPALLLVELGITFTAWRDGWLAEKRRAWRDAVRSGHLVREGRRMVAATRVVGDDVILAGMGHSLAAISQIRPPAGTGVVDALLGLWQRIALPVVRFLDRFG